MFFSTDDFCHMDYSGMYHFVGRYSVVFFCFRRRFRRCAFSYEKTKTKFRQHLLLAKTKGQRAALGPPLSKKQPAKMHGICSGPSEPFHYDTPYNDTSVLYVSMNLCQTPSGFYFFCMHYNTLELEQTFLEQT